MTAVPKDTEEEQLWTQGAGMGISIILATGFEAQHCLGLLCAVQVQKGLLSQRKQRGVLVCQGVQSRTLPCSITGSLYQSGV